MTRLANLPATGWFSADLHVHMNYGGCLPQRPRRTLAFQARAEDLHLVENLIVNKEGRVPDIGYFTGRPDPVSTASTLIVHDQEYHTSFWGHTRTAGASTQPHPARLRRLREHRRGESPSHQCRRCSTRPTRRRPSPATSIRSTAIPIRGTTTKPLTHELPVDVALGKVDYYEAIGFVDDYDATARVWYRLLNCGFRLPTGAGTDAMANFASLRGPVGHEPGVRQAGRLR